MTKTATTPLKITAHLLDGRIDSADGIIMLDGILYHAWFIKHAPHVLEGEGVENYSGYVGLPLRQLNNNRWAASKGVYIELSQTIEHINKRPDFFAAEKLDLLDMDSGIISDAVGIYRAHRIPSVIRLIKDNKIEWWCMGHKDEVKSLLNLIPFIGKKGSAGYGIVTSWDVEDAEADYSLIHPIYGLMRPTPICETEEAYNCATMLYGVKPPYHKPSNMQLCYVPIMEGRNE